MFKYDQNSGSFDLITSKVIIDPLVQGVEDLSIITSLDGNYLIVGVSSFVESNILKSYSIDQNSGDLTEVFNITFGEWEESAPLPLRISSVTISADGKYVFVGFSRYNTFFLVRQITIFLSINIFTKLLFLSLCLTFEQI